MIAATREVFEPRPMKDYGHANGNGSAATKPSRKAASAKSADRFATINNFVDNALADLTRVQALTWLTLWRHERGGKVELSAGAIAKTIGASRRAVIDALAELQTKGLLKLTRRGGQKEGANRYQLTPGLVKPTSPP